LITLFDIVIRILLIVATTSLFGIVLIAYLRMKTTKLLLILLGFGFHVIYALLGIAEIFGPPIIIEENIHLLLHLLALVFLLVGILKD